MIKDNDYSRKGETAGSHVRQGFQRILKLISPCHYPPLALATIPPSPLPLSPYPCHYPPWFLPLSPLTLATIPPAYLERAEFSVIAWNLPVIMGCTPTPILTESRLVGRWVILPAFLV